MLSIVQWAAISASIMAIDTLVRTGGAGVVQEDGHVRDTVNTRLRFTSNGGALDNSNGTAFTKYMREQGVVVDARTSRSMTVASADLVRLFA